MVDLLPGVLVADRYHVESLLGQGGMGSVYRCEDTMLGETVALKFLHTGVASDPKMLKRFIDEIKVARQIQHKSVIHGFDLGEWNGMRFIVMQHVEGKPLNQILAERGKLPAPEAVAIATQVLAGLKAAHDAGVVHRDLKTDNILVNASGNAFILDFGIARRMTAVRMTMSGEVLGSPLYLSPEQAMGRDVDPRADLYSLGVILFEMLTGDVPYNGFDALAVALKHVNEPVVSPRSIEPSIPPLLDAIIVRCLQKDPEARYADAMHLLTDLLRDGMACAAPDALSRSTPPGPPRQDGANRNSLRTTPPPPRAAAAVNSRRSWRLGAETFYHSHRIRSEDEEAIIE